MTGAHVLTPEQLRRLDAEYRPIEPFDAWADLAPPASVWDRYVERYEAVRAQASPEALAAALMDIMRGAAFDSGAIEGLYPGDRGITQTVIEQAAAWEAYVAQERGHQVVDYVKSHVEGFRMALDVANGRQPISEAWVRQVHEVVCEPQTYYEVTTPVARQRHLLPKGEYKREPNHVLQPDGSRFAYAPVPLVAVEMARLVEQVRRPEFGQAHPSAQAAYLHYAFVRIHPFSDGNGRVARVLASVPLLRALSVPLLVYADERPRYLAALRSADADQPRELVEFIADQAAAAASLVPLVLSRSSLKDARSRFLTAYEAAASVSDEALEPVVVRIVELLVEAWNSAVEDLQLPGVYASNVVMPSRSEVDQEYRVIPRAGSGVGLEIRVAGVRRLDRTIWLTVAVARSASNPFALRVERHQSEDALDLRLAEVEPRVSAAARARVDAWVQQLLSTELDALATDMEH